MAQATRKVLHRTFEPAGEIGKLGTLSGMLHGTNLYVDSELVVVTEVDDVVAAAAGTLGAT